MTAPVSWMEPSGKSTRLPTAPTLGSASAMSTSGCSHPASTSVSSLRNTRYRPAAAATIWLQPAANPRLTGDSKTRTRAPGASSTARMSWSAPLSRTRISCETSSGRRAKAARQRSRRWGRCRVRTTIETVGGPVTERGAARSMPVSMPRAGTRFASASRCSAPRADSAAEPGSRQ